MLGGALVDSRCLHSRTVKAFEGPVSLSSTDSAAEESLFSTKTSSSSQGNNFKVVVRIRPPIRRETEGSDTDVDDVFT